MSFAVTNNGTAAAGSEVPQLYLGFPAAAGEPPKVLAGFAKLRDVAPGQAVRVTLNLTARALSTWDTAKQACVWRIVMCRCCWCSFCWCWW